MVFRPKILNKICLNPRTKVFFSLFPFIFKMTDKTENKSSLSEAEEFLESLNLPDSQNQDTDGNATSGPTDPNDIMSFLDEISNYPTEDEKTPQQTPVTTTPAATTTTAIQPKQSQAQAVTEPVVSAAASAATAAAAATPNTTAEQPQDNGWKSWGNSFWSQASAAVKTTTDQINRTVTTDSASKLLESRVKTLQSLVNKENIEKLGKT